MDIGGTKCAYLLARQDGGGLRFFERAEFPTAGKPEDVLSTLLGGVENALAKAGLSAKDLAACGISCGGPLDAKKGLILSPPNLPGWDGIPAAEIVSRRLGVPARLRNDADACALAEWKYGAGRGCGDFVFLTFGTGLGAGLILNGQLYEGASGAAGEAGHIRLESNGPAGYGKRGSFEGFCSGQGIAKLAAAMFPERADFADASAKRLAQAANGGDGDALEVFRLCGEKFGRGLSVLIDLLNPARIAVGGVFSRCEGLIRPAMERALHEEALPMSLAACKVVRAELGERIGDYGACMAALYE